MHCDSDLQPGLSTHTTSGEGGRDQGESEMHDGEISPPTPVHVRNASQSTSPQVYMPASMLNSRVKFGNKEVEKMKSIDKQEIFKHSGRELYAANKMHRDKIQAAGFPCDKNLRESASP